LGLRAYLYPSLEILLLETMLRNTASVRLLGTLKKHGPLPAGEIAKRARCKASTAQTILNKLVYEGNVSFLEMRLGRFAKQKGGPRSGRTLRLYYLPRVHRHTQIIKALRRLIVIKAPSSASERRAFGMWLSSAILPNNVRELIHSSIFVARHKT
jgi:DNA-binding MarR family transcriptional regulator